MIAFVVGMGVGIFCGIVLALLAVEHAETHQGGHRVGVWIVDPDPMPRLADPRDFQAQHLSELREQFDHEQSGDVA